MKRILDRPSRKPRTKSQMAEYLQGHARYNTMNSWNGSTSYSNCVKVSHLNLTNEERDFCYEALDISHAHDESGFNMALRDFDREHQYRYQIGSNGRSGGYLVLYRGETKSSGYKSYCDECHQNNYKTTEESGVQCGRCGAMSRVNYPQGHEPRQISTFPGQSIGGESFEDWSLADFKSEVDLVWEFDAACEEACRRFLSYAKERSPQEKMIMVPKRIIVSVPRIQES